MTVITVASAAALSAALANAQGGDTIVLQSGNYGTLNLQNVHFATRLNIVSANRANPAIFNSLNIENSAGLAFSGVTVKGSGTGVWYYANIINSSDVFFINGTIEGSDSNLANDAGGLNIQGSRRIHVKGSTFTQLTTGISNGGTLRVNVENNSFFNIQSDGIDSAGSSYLNITGNYFSDFSPAPGQHPDGIQFWTENTTVSAHDITISGNTIIRGAGAAVQGIFVQDDSGKLPYLRLQISNNVVTGEGYNGIAVQGSNGAIVSGNIVQPYADEDSWIEVQGSSGASLTNNAAGSYVLTGNTSLSNVGNTILSPMNGPIASAISAGGVTDAFQPSVTETVAHRLVEAMAGFNGPGGTFTLIDAGSRPATYHMLATPLA
ncbi:MAG TPA: right-handed parallel beta-helix repeat-containing protein [Caulobacteraceae bacterium]|nr:right-handed parallel beta-helix repeat-containing protein [Caulobacteraceae bacterium]